MQLIERKYLLQGFHVLGLGADPRMLGSSAASMQVHFASHVIKAAFVAGTVRTAPGDPFTLAVAGALMDVSGQLVKTNTGHNKRH